MCASSSRTARACTRSSGSANPPTSCRSWTTACRRRSSLLACALLATAAFAEGPLDRARSLAADGKAQAACDAYAQALSSAGLSAADRAEARYRRALLLERELHRDGEALLEYRLYLQESRDVFARTTRVVEGRIADLESCLGPDGDLQREIARIERGDEALTREDVTRIEDLLYARRASPLAGRLWLALGRLCQDPAIAQWRKSLAALDRAEARGISPEETDPWRRRGRLEQRRERIALAGVAVAALILAATGCLSPWRKARRADWVLMLKTAVPGLLLAAAWGGLYVGAVRGETRLPAQGPAVLGMAAVVLLNSTMLGVALRGRRLARALVPTSALALSAAGVAIFCWLFDCFPIFGL